MRPHHLVDEALLALPVAVVAGMGVTSTLALRTSLLRQVDERLVAAGHRAGNASAHVPLAVATTAPRLEDDDRPPWFDGPGQDVGTVNVVASDEVLGGYIAADGQYRTLSSGQTAALLGKEWLAHPDCKDPVLLLGDFNATSRYACYGQIAHRLRDAQLALQKQQGRAGRAIPTFPSRFPVLRIDHVFVSKGIEVLDVRVPDWPQARAASDHLPLVVDIEVG